jgi:hypothetical protein
MQQTLSKRKPVLSASSELLTIQKFISLLNDFHYMEFRSYLQETNAVLSIRLVEAIRNMLPLYDSHDELCCKVYGSCKEAEKKRFNQLSVHTFKLSNYLANNYPDYLVHNIQKVQELVNTNNPEGALKLVKYLRDIAERIEDFRTQIWCLQFLCNDARLNKDTIRAVKLGEQLAEVLDTEALYIQIQHQLTISARDEQPPNGGLEKCKAEMEKYFEHPSVVVQMAALYAYNNYVYHFDSKHFQDPKDLSALNLLEAKLNQHPQIVFPFMTNMYGNSVFIKLSAAYPYINEKDRNGLYNELEDYYRNVKFTSEYVRDGQLYLIAIECSRLISNYYHYLQQPDYHKILHATNIQSIHRKLQTCEQLLSVEVKRKSNEGFVANIKMLYGALYVILGGEKNIRKGIQELEALLIMYQQMSLKASSDGIFMVLAIAYFALGEYEKCTEVFKRYSKVKKAKNVYDGNDEKIAAYYYSAQWLLTGRKQYKQKLKAVVYRKELAKPTASLLEFLRLVNIDLESV